jgi:hypothetical protein
LKFREIGGIIGNESNRCSSMKTVIAIFGPVPPNTSPLDGFFCLAIGLLGLLYIPTQLSKMDCSKQWPKLALEVAVLLFFVITGIVIISKRL